MAEPALTIGHAAEGQPVALQLDRLIGSHAGIVANSGGGKSGLLRRILETTHGRVQHIVLDPEDEFYSLRERLSYVIAGGEGGDIPATISSAAALARATLEHGFSLIVQLNDLGANAPEFVAGFLQGLMSAPRETWRPVLIPIDEAQRFVPSGGAGTAATAAVRDLLFRGRKRGFTAIVASLRISLIDPGVRGMCNNWLLGRVGQALDRNLMADQLGFTAKEGRDRLRAIEERHFYGFGPAIAAEPILFRVDDVQTTPVRAGQAKVPTPPAPDALRKILAGLPSPSPTQDPTIPAEPIEAFGAGAAAGEMLVERDRRIAALEVENAHLIQQCEKLRVDRNRHLKTATRLAVAVRQATQFLQSLQLASDQPEDLKTASADSAAMARPSRRASGQGVAGDQPGGAAKPATPEAGDREYRALAGLASIHPAGMTEAAWATRTGYSRKGGAWNRRRKRYLDAGLIEERDGRWFATPLGIERSGQEASDFPAPGAELVDWWARRIGAPGRLLKTLAGIYPRGLTRGGLAAELGMSAAGGAFTRHVSALKAANLVTEAGKRLTLASELVAETK